MSLEAIGAVLVVLVVVFIFSRVWFHLVESVLGFIKRLFCKRAEPSTWHRLPTTSAEEKNRTSTGKAD